MSDDPLRQLVRDLIRLGVGMAVEGGQPTLTLPEGEPRRTTAERAVRAGLELIRGDRGRAVRMWPEVAAEEGTPVALPRADEPARCRECRATVVGVVPARDDVLVDPNAEYLGWAFCESLSCPCRTDEWAGRYQYRHVANPETRAGLRAARRGKLAIQRRTRALALGEEPGEPIPD